jgi:hypothetical protein
MERFSYGGDKTRKAGRSEALSSRLITITSYPVVGFSGVRKPWWWMTMPSTLTPKSDHCNRFTIRPMGDEPFAENLLPGHVSLNNP